MRIFEEFLNRSEFSSYKDFKENFKVNVPENFNYGFDVVDRLGMEKPDKLALLWTNVAGDERRFTFADIMRNSNKVANYLKSQGIKRGDKVMLILKRHYQFWFSIIALHKLGAVCIPATHLLTKKDLVYRNNAASVKAIICTSDGEIAEHVEASQAESPTLEMKFIVNGDREGWLNLDAGMEACSDVLPRPAGEEATHNEDMMLLYFTSGTTGMPKMVGHDFVYPLGHIVTGAFWHQVQEDGIHLTVSDTGWGKAVWGKLYGQWMAETVVFVYDFDKFIPEDLLAVLEKYRITTFCAPPTIYRFLIKANFSSYDLSSLSYCTVAGEPLNPEVFNQFRKLTGIKLYEGFGQTETTLTVATYPWMEPRPGSMGLPSPGYDIDIVDEDGKPSKPGEVGQIVIRTDKGKPLGMFRGYYRDDALTAKMWHDDVYYTGDMAWKDEQGYFWYEGRADDVIKSSGYRIGPFEVESVLLQHPAVLEAAISGAEDPIRGIVVKATIVLAQGYEASDALTKELQNYVKTNTAPYKYPRVVEYVEELPKTISGKIRRVELRNRK
nr:AMP-binding protein [Clostridium sp. BSD2780061688b_171218_E8]